MGIFKNFLCSIGWHKIHAVSSIGGQCQWCKSYWFLYPHGKPYKKQTCEIYCPTCKKELISSDSDRYEGGKTVNFVCFKCETQSNWDFDAPAPILKKIFYK